MKTQMIFLAMLLVLVFSIQSRSEVYSAISKEHKEYCEGFARHEAGMDNIGELANAFMECISVLPARLPYSTEPQGTVPAGVDPNEETWRAECRAEYRSWDEATGTVVRRGSSERVRCPCGSEVTCVQQ